MSVGFNDGTTDRTADEETKVKVKGKDRASDKKIIPIPNAGPEDDVELEDEDVEMLEEYGGAAGFMSHLDKEGIAR